MFNLSPVTRATPKRNPLYISLLHTMPTFKGGKMHGFADVQLPYPDAQFNGTIEVEAAHSSPDWPDQVTAPPSAPNVVIFMTDDVGYGSADTFGGPAHTPNMTRVGKEGLTYNRFHTTAMCSPTRAALLTGRHPHNVATGYVVDSGTGYPGYCSSIPKSCATIGQILKMNGYSTGWFGKNHNIPTWQTSSSGPFDHWPTGLGFEHFYGFNGGDADQYSPLLFNDTTPIQPYEGNPDYHLDNDLADQAIQFIKERHALNRKKPFFLYYVPGATHAPHQVPEEYVTKYKGKFDDGWDDLRVKTLENQKELGLCPQDTKLSPRPDNIPAWVEFPEDHKAVFLRMVEVYCGYLEMTDRNIGRVLDYIDEIGQTDNTLVIYIMGDNGGSAEGSVQGTTNESAVMGNGVAEDFNYIKESADELGTALHFNHIPVQWAWALNSPMQWAKRYASHFGGTRNGMVMRWPKHIRDNGSIRTQFHHVIDILPTILEAAKIPRPIAMVNGIEQKPFDGVSMAYTWKSCNENKEKRPEMVFEMAGNRGLYQEGWMLCTTPQDFAWVKGPNADISEESFEWELYNVKEDFSQANDLLKVDNPTAENLQRKEDMYDRYMVLAAENNILPLCFTGKERRKGQVGKPDITDGYGTFEYPNGIVRIPEPCAPDCKNVSFTIEAFLNVPVRVPVGKERMPLEGVVYSMGGRFGGFGLVVLEGKATWVYKLAQWPGAYHRIDATEKLKKGKSVVKIEFNYLGGTALGKGAEMIMSINGVEIGRKTIEQTVRAYFSLSETLDIGMDTGSPLLDEYQDLMPFKFTGGIDKVKFVVDDSNLDEDAKFELGKARQTYMINLD